ncbi:hypothetical protein AVEN_142073-1 [Araneus ventricosus]|uniref:Uncharacterized protein n=1 Tax=Araneus ventricosus TaxID=182803 RepID=A0A4Y2M9Q0_ARAVE|nr:hypothetical protein AVEN_142073-1 [Araneus ventricosus]
MVEVDSEVLMEMSSKHTVTKIIQWVNYECSPTVTVLSIALTVYQLTSLHCEQNSKQRLSRLSTSGIYSFPTGRDVTWTFQKNLQISVPKIDSVKILTFSRNFILSPKSSNFSANDPRVGCH